MTWDMVREAWLAYKTPHFIYLATASTVLFTLLCAGFAFSMQQRPAAPPSRGDDELFWDYRKELEERKRWQELAEKEQAKRVEQMGPAVSYMPVILFAAASAICVGAYFALMN